MKFGVREICDVVLKMKDKGWFGDLWLEKNMPVIYFDTLKTSSLEGAATTVYAQGGKGNPRLVAWEGDRTVTFTMEDALISPQSFSILSGAGLMDASDTKPIYVHTTEQIAIGGSQTAPTIKLSNAPSAGNNPTEDEAYVYLMVMNKDGIIDTSYPPFKLHAEDFFTETTETQGETTVTKKVPKEVTIDEAFIEKMVGEYTDDNANDLGDTVVKTPTFARGNIVFVDYYVEAASNVKQIDIEAGKFGGSYYLEASTLFRDQATGNDYPAEFIIPNCKIQSNFTFTMASTGDPSTFTFTMDAFPEYTRFDKTKKVIAAIQIVEDLNLIK